MPKKKVRLKKEQRKQEEFIDLSIPYRKEKKENLKERKQNSRELHKENLISALNGVFLLKKSEYDVGETIKYTIGLTSSSNSNSVALYKIYLCHSDGLKYLVNMGKLKIKKKKSLSGTIKFSEILPPVNSVYLKIELYQNYEMIKAFESKILSITCAKPQKYIQIKSAKPKFVAQKSDKALLFWISTTLKAFPGQRECLLNINVNYGAPQPLIKQVPINIEYNVHLNSHTTLKPYKVLMPSVSNNTTDLNLSLEIIDTLSSSVLYKTKWKIPESQEIKSIILDNVQYQRNTEIGDMAYMFAEIRNNCMKKIKGKIQVSFYTEELGTVRGFNRKFKIDRESYDTISEDIPYFEFLAGFNYWIVANSIIKIGSQKYNIENISDMKEAKQCSSPVYFAKLRINVPNSKIIKSGDKYAVGVDCRLNVKNPQKNLAIQVIEEYENISRRILYEVPTKNREIINGSFHWRVPKSPGRYIIYTQYCLGGKILTEKSIQSNRLTYEIR